METRYTDINVKIVPKSSRNEIVEEKDNSYRIKLTAPPVDGKANKALINLLSKKLGKPKKDIEIVSGDKSRNKRIRIYNISSLEIAGHLK